MASYHHGNLRASLIDEAISHLQNQPDSELSLRQLAIATGVSNNAPYRHFKNKQALLDSVAEEGFRRLSLYIQDAYFSAPERQRDISHAAQSYVEFAYKHAQLYQLMFAPPATEDLQKISDARSLLVTLFSQILEQGEGQQLDAHNREFAANTIFSYLHGVVSMDIKQSGLLSGAPYEYIAQIPGMLQAIISSQLPEPKVVAL